MSGFFKAKDSDSFAAQDGIDYGKWLEFMKEAESFSEPVLSKMIDDLIAVSETSLEDADSSLFNEICSLDKEMKKLMESF